MLNRRRAPALLAVLAGSVALSACGGPGGGDGRAPSPTPSPASAQAAPGQRPEVDVDFADGASGELPAVEGPSGAGAHAGQSYRLRLARAGTVRAPARRVTQPGTAGVSVVATVRAPTARAGPGSSAAVARTVAAAMS